MKRVVLKKRAKYMTDEEKQRILRMHGKGMTPCQMHKEMGRTRTETTIAQYLKREGLTPHRTVPDHRVNPRSGGLRVSGCFDESNPLLWSINTLDKRVEEKKGVYWLDGLPANITALVRAGNKLRIKNKEPQFTQNSAWVISEEEQRLDEVRNQ